MQMSFYVSHAGQTYGPWTVEEIMHRIAQMELIATDFIFDESRDGWVPLMECDAVVSALSMTKPSAPPPKAPVVSGGPSSREVPAEKSALAERPSVTSSELHDASSADAQWFVQKETHRYGPFTYLGMIKALQEKSIFDFDLISRKGEEKWVRLAEHEMFSPEAIRAAMKTSGHETSKFFFERKFPRFPVSSEVIVHDNKSVWLGQTFQSSEGGSGMLIRNALLVPGQVLHLHFTEFEGIPAFNALCEVVNKKYVPNVRDPRASVPYGVKFVSIDSGVREAMKEYFSTKAA